MTAPTYPGYKSTCNGCGVCCLTAPCAVSRQLNQWQDGKCRALGRDGERYVCKVITEPASIAKWLAKVPLDQRLSAIGSMGKCDHRAAWNEKDAIDLLHQRNIQDELANNPVDSYPRGCVLHNPDGTKVLFFRKDKYSLIERNEVTEQFINS